MEVYLVRHTSVERKPGHCYGSLDVDLSPTFAEEAAVVRAKLPPDLLSCAVYASPLKRCRMLAERLTSGDIDFDDRLREYHFGEWEGKLPN